MRFRNRVNGGANCECKLSLCVVPQLYTVYGILGYVLARIGFALFYFKLCKTEPCVSLLIA